LKISRGCPELWIDDAHKLRKQELITGPAHDYHCSLVITEYDDKIFMIDIALYTAQVDNYTSKLITKILS